MPSWLKHGFYRPEKWLYLVTILNRNREGGKINLVQNMKFKQSQLDIVLKLALFSCLYFSASKLK